MLSPRAHAFIAGGLFAAIVILAAIGSALHDSGVLADGAALQHGARLLFFGLFLLFGLSCVPLMVQLFVAGHHSFGNPAVARAFAPHQGRIVLALWLLMGAGLAVAVPAAVEDGFFSDLNDPAAAITATPTQGRLVAQPGMTVDEMLRASTLPLEGGKVVYAGGAIFDFTMPGSTIVVPGCRYYYINFDGPDRRITQMSIGASPSKLSLAALEAAETAMRARLAEDGWRSGHEVYRDAMDQGLHHGALRGPDGALWLKGEVVLHVARKRMDDAKPGEDTATAGEWIQTLELGQRARWPWIERYVFDAARRLDPAN